MLSMRRSLLERAPTDLDKQCSNCGILSHFSKVCNSKKMNAVDEKTEPDSPELYILDSIVVDSVTSDTADDYPKVNINIKGKKEPITFKLDAGSAADTIPISSFSLIQFQG